jgi:hypothetical protein
VEESGREKRREREAGTRCEQRYYIGLEGKRESLWREL